MREREGAVGRLPTASRKGHTSESREPRAGRPPAGAARRGSSDSSIGRPGAARIPRIENIGPLTTMSANRSQFVSSFESKTSAGAARRGAARIPRIENIGPRHLRRRGAARIQFQLLLVSVSFRRGADPVTRKHRPASTVTGPASAARMQRLVRVSSTTPPQHVRVARAISLLLSVAWWRYGTRLKSRRPWRCC